ncbi:hypothetical protein [Ktedonobacter robiniae]|nr:hypothetical protein [Ktedonobacter robiniae]
MEGLVGIRLPALPYSLFLSDAGAKRLEHPEELQHNRHLCYTMQ